MRVHSYNDTFETISRYANDSLHLFADRWSRFPGEQVSQQLIATLEQKKTFWTGRTPDLWGNHTDNAEQAIQNAIDDLRYYMERL